MRKTTKGAIAVGAGVALLLGGAGTMAHGRPVRRSRPSISSGSLTSSPRWARSPRGRLELRRGHVRRDELAHRPGRRGHKRQVFTVTARGDRLKAAAAEFTAST